MGSRVRRNFFANFVGLGWAAALQLICAPIYLRSVSVEGFGLIGVFLTLQTVLLAFDFGLGATVNRELARYETRPEASAETRDFVRTIEAIYWILGVAIMTALLVAAPFAARDWFHESSIAPADLKLALQIIGIAAGVQWLASFYTSALYGMQRHGVLNTVKIVAATFGYLGSVVVLQLSPTVISFFTWNAAVAVVQLGVLVVLLWRSIPPSGIPARITPRLALGVWRFAMGVSGITACAVVLTQVDKIVVSRLLPLTTFGYYTLAALVTSALSFLITPVYNTIYPRLAELHAAGDEPGLRGLYHGSAQVLAVLVFSAAAVLFFFAGDLIEVWTGAAQTAAHVAPIVQFLVIGSALNGVMYAPYALQLATGWTRLGLYIVLGQTIVIIPAAFVLTHTYGVMGAAAVWPLLNLAYVLVGVPLTHRNILPGDGAASWLMDVVPPLLVTVCIAGVARLVPLVTLAPGMRVLFIGAVGAVTLAAAAMTAPRTRVVTLNMLLRKTA